MAISQYESRDPLSDSNISSFAMSLNVTTSPVSTYLEMAAADVILKYVYPFIVFLGTFGNMTSFVVLMRRRMRVTSVYFFLTVLAVADTIMLFVSAFKTWIRVLTGWELLVYSSATCKTVFFLVLFSQHMAAWVVVLVTIDRFIAVWFPLRATSWCTVRRAYIVTAITTVTVIIYR